MAPARPTTTASASTMNPTTAGQRVAQSDRPKPAQQDSNCAPHEASQAPTAAQSADCGCRRALRQACALLVGNGHTREGTATAHPSNVRRPLSARWAAPLRA
jgi:hypothetical protein